jgi:uncharacterized membrane protein
MPVKKFPPQKKSAAANAVNNAITQQKTVIATRKQEIFRGPLPSPDILEKYEKILPGISERIVAMAEKEQAMRETDITATQKQKAALLEIAKKESEGALKAQNKGQNIGLIIAGACILCALICALKGMNYLIVLGFLAVPTASFITAFFPRTKDTQKQSKD